MTALTRLGVVARYVGLVLKGGSPVLTTIEAKVDEALGLLKEIRDTTMALDPKYQQLIDLTAKRTTLEQSLITAFQGLLAPIANANAADDDAALDKAIADAQAAIPMLAAAVPQNTSAAVAKAVPVISLPDDTLNAGLPGNKSYVPPIQTPGDTSDPNAAAPAVTVSGAGTSAPATGSNLSSPAASPVASQTPSTPPAATPATSGSGTSSGSSS